ncbi:MAG: twin-arginine translocase TatA/TatE family subunit [Candidatus Omnitrophica bacterium]|nr:twin-arginine translocase TatA/TatE family subunit [Candidatus Omnitrophota bacterium]
MGNLGIGELVVIAIIALVVVGPTRLPELARGVGNAVRAFQDALRGSKHE